MCHKCRKCDIKLVIGKNWHESGYKYKNYICKSCMKTQNNEYKHNHKKRLNDNRREYLHRIGSNQPMSKNRSCPMFLGIHVAERVLSNVFENVKRMPLHNKGFDFVCARGYRVDVKASCVHTRDKWSHWQFKIRKNVIADYFLCIAFDNRYALTPLHLWLVPGLIINHLTSTSISKSTLAKWNEYKLDIEKVINCCEAIR